MTAPYREQGIVPQEVRVASPHRFLGWMRDWWREARRLSRQADCACDIRDSLYEWFSENREFVVVDVVVETGPIGYWRVQVFEKCRMCDRMRERAVRDPASGLVRRGAVVS